MAPNFHESKIHSDISFDRCQFLDIKNENAVRYYRALKLVMGQHRATSEEMMFYALEQQSKYYHRDTQLNEKITSLIYKITSDYGRSIIRPIVVLIGILVVFFFLYLCETFHTADFKSSTAFKENLVQVIQFTISQTIKPFYVWSRPGIESAKVISGHMSVLCIQLQALIQSLLSIIPVTLFVLAIRRKFRMN